MWFCCITKAALEECTEVLLDWVLLDWVLLDWVLLDWVLLDWVLLVLHSQPLPLAQETPRHKHNWMV